MGWDGIGSPTASRTEKPFGPGWLEGSEEGRERERERERYRLDEIMRLAHVFASTFSDQEKFS